MTLEEIITPKLLSNFDRLMLNIKVKTTSAVMGKRKSNQKGSSLDFSDYRAYSQGDDIRKIDWNGYARSGKTNIKLYNEEKQSKVNIIIDCSKSMNYGEETENKLLYGKILSAALSYIHIKNDDNVSIYALNDFLSPIIVNNSTKQGFNSIVKKLDKISCFEGDLSEKKYKFNALKRGGLTFVISDFYTDNGYEDIINSLQRIDQRIILIHILTKEELEPEINGDYKLADIENNSSKNIFVNSDIILEYKRLLNIHKNNIKNYSCKRNVIYFDFSTDISILGSIFEILRRE